MSHSSGIPVGKSLKDAFGAAIQDANTRLVKAQIENDEIISITTESKSGSFEDDLSIVQKLLDADRASYILMRMDSDSPKFTLFCYVPDKSKVKEKMIYASTRSNLKQQLGANFFVDEIFGTLASDFSVQGYKLHKESQKAEAPLTDSEKIKQRELESGEVYSGGASTYVHGVSFPVDNKAMDALSQLMKGSVNYVQIAIDINAEKVICDHTAKLDLEGLKGKISNSEPRFHFFSYAHEFEGQQVSQIVYIYSCPDGSNGTKSAPVKMRMLYSSSKANVANILGKVEGTISGRLEINTAEELSEEILMNILHPQAEAKKEGFAKPTRNVKGPRRLIKEPSGKK